jgi:hypothetical protein
VLDRVVRVTSGAGSGHRFLQQWLAEPAATTGGRIVREQNGVGSTGSSMGVRDGVGNASSAF